MFAAGEGDIIAREASSLFAAGEGDIITRRARGWFAGKTRRDTRKQVKPAFRQVNLKSSRAHDLGEAVASFFIKPDIDVRTNRSLDDLLEQRRRVDKTKRPVAIGGCLSDVVMILAARADHRAADPLDRKSVV